jgi:hypothetical protein
MIVLLLCLFLYKITWVILKTTFIYLFIALFAFAFSYKTIRYLSQSKIVNEAAYTDTDCENGKENTIEKDEIKDFYYTRFFDLNQLIITEETFSPAELVVHFTTANYSNAIYSPPELLS